MGSTLAVFTGIGLVGLDSATFLAGWFVSAGAVLSFRVISLGPFSEGDCEEIGGVTATLDFSAGASVLTGFDLSAVSCFWATGYGAAGATFSFFTGGGATACFSSVFVILGR